MQMSEKRKGGNEKIPHLEKFFIIAQTQEMSAELRFIR
jgi:hypothetical protein